MRALYNVQPARVTFWKFNWIQLESYFIAISRNKNYVEDVVTDKSLNRRTILVHFLMDSCLLKKLNFGIHLDANMRRERYLLLNFDVGHLRAATCFLLFLFCIRRMEHVKFEKFIFAVLISHHDPWFHFLYNKERESTNLCSLVILGKQSLHQFSNNSW